MIVLFISVSWTLSLLLVTALCRAARRGDLQLQTAPPVRPSARRQEWRVVAVLTAASAPSELAVRARAVAGADALSLARRSQSWGESVLRAR